MDVCMSWPAAVLYFIHAAVKLTLNVLAHVWGYHIPSPA